MMVGFEGSKLTREVIDMISNNKIGSIILFSRNIESDVQVARLNKELQSLAKKNGHQNPLIIATDQENGIVRRLSESILEFPGNMVLGAVDDPKTTYEISNATAKVMKSLGINMNLAPVLDVNSNPKNPVIGVRSFGENVQEVVSHGVAFIKGHQSIGVMTSGKHFPGHGNTYHDSHLEIPVVASPYNNLKEVELAPFIAAIRNDVASILISHVHYSEIDNEQKLPASISKNIITELLRKELHYNGLVLTDCLEMDAISKTVGTPAGALEALKSGADILIVSHTYAQQIKVIDHIEQAISNGEITMKVIDESLRRINSVKQKYLKWESEVILSKEELAKYEKLAISTYQKGVTIVKNNGYLPLPQKENISIHAIWMLENSQTIAEDNQDVILSIKKIIEPSTKIKVSEQILSSDFSTIDSIANEADVIVLFTDYQKIDVKQVATIHQRLDGNKLIVVAVKSPYILSHFTDVQALMATYEPSELAIRACMDVITGAVESVGKLPVTI